MSGVEMRELECVLVLAEELHFGRTAERLRISQGRVSQLVSTLERRIGGRLFERTSRRVTPTVLGHAFLGALRPAYERLDDAVQTARDQALGVAGPLRLGFSGVFDEGVTSMVTAFESAYPGSAIELRESPLSDPFGPVRRGEVDATIVFGAIEEPDLVVGASFDEHPQALVVSVRHPLADRVSVSAEDLAGRPMIGYSGTAPPYWHESVAPTMTPRGRAIPMGPRVATLQEGLTAIAANRGAMVFCLPTALRLRRSDLAVVPVDDLPESPRSLIWRRGSDSARLRAFAELVAGSAHPRRPTRRPVSA